MCSRLGDYCLLGFLLHFLLMMSPHWLHHYPYFILLAMHLLAAVSILTFNTSTAIKQYHRLFQLWRVYAVVDRASNCHCQKSYRRRGGFRLDRLYSWFRSINHLFAWRWYADAQNAPVSGQAFEDLFPFNKKARPVISILTLIRLAHMADERLLLAKSQSRARRH